jgi:DNA-binding HxlR family transcriptional regulator
MTQDTAGREILSRLGDKWSVLTIHMIAGETIRFSELKRRIMKKRPISSCVLTRTLKQLERDGLVTRQVFPVVPPRVDYSLTRHGEKFLQFSREIIDWTQEFRADFEAARGSFEAREAERPALAPADARRPVTHSPIENLIEAAAR